ncbi:MAG: hypothetical protein SGARI_006726, partial [Bacillariaceae sp.]
NEEDANGVFPTAESSQNDVSPDDNEYDLEEEDDKEEDTYSNDREKCIDELGKRLEEMLNHPVTEKFPLGKKRIDHFIAEYLQAWNENDENDQSKSILLLIKLKIVQWEVMTMQYCTFQNKEINQAFAEQDYEMVQRFFSTHARTKRTKAKLDALENAHTVTQWVEESTNLQFPVDTEDLSDDTKYENAEISVIYQAAKTKELLDTYRRGRRATMIANLEKGLRGEETALVSDAREAARKVQIHPVFFALVDRRLMKLMEAARKHLIFEEFNETFHSGNEKFRNRSLYVVKAKLHNRKRCVTFNLFDRQTNGQRRIAPSTGVDIYLETASESE